MHSTRFLEHCCILSFWNISIYYINSIKLNPMDTYPHWHLGTVWLKYRCYYWVIAAPPRSVKDVLHLLHSSLRIGGETASTGIRKLWLHVELLSARKTTGPKYNRRRLWIRSSRLRLASFRTTPANPERTTTCRIAGHEFPLHDWRTSSGIALQASCLIGTRIGEHSRSD